MIGALYFIVFFILNGSFLLTFPFYFSLYSLFWLCLGNVNTIGLQFGFVCYCLDLLLDLRLKVGLPWNFAAYSLDEVEEKAKSLRESVKYSAGENASALDVSFLECVLTFYLIQLFCDLCQ